MRESIRLIGVCAAMLAIVWFLANLLIGDDRLCTITHEPYAAFVEIDGTREMLSPRLHCGSTYHVVVWAPGYEDAVVDFTPHWWNSSLHLKLVKKPPRIGDRNG